MADLLYGMRAAGRRMTFVISGGSGRQIYQTWPTVLLRVLLCVLLHVTTRSTAGAASRAPVRVVDGQLVCDDALYGMTAAFANMRGCGGVCLFCKAANEGVAV